MAVQNLVRASAAFSFRVSSVPKGILGQGKVQILAAGVQALQAVLAALDEVYGVVQRHPVAGGQHEVADGLVAVEVGHVADGEEVVQALGHLLIVHVDEAVVHPVAGKGAAVGALALCDLILVVGEDQILTAAVQINGLARWVRLMALHSICQPGRPMP